MKRAYLPLLLAMCVRVGGVMAQSDTIADQRTVLSELKVEVRGAFDYKHLTNIETENDKYGFCGQFFMLRMGGDLSEHVSYYLRQRIIAKPGSASLFDNTDFLYLNYRPNDRWNLRVGKDGMMIGGYEYDADPIDVYFNTYFLDMVECFQLAASASYTLSEGQTLTAQLSNSPWIFADAAGSENYGKEYSQGLLSYNLMWSGHIGRVQTMYSVNMMERQRGYFTNMIALGQRLQAGRWDIYIDLMHRALSTDDWGKNYAAIARVAYETPSGLTLFVKGVYETNHSKEEYSYADYALQGLRRDLLARPETDNCIYGIGGEYVPKGCPSVRMHAFLSHHFERHPQLSSSATETNSELYASLGITWRIDVRQSLRQMIASMTR